MRLGLLLPTRDRLLDRAAATAPLLDLAVQAEAAGRDSVWAGDSPLARPRRGTPAGFVAWLEGYRQAGAEHVVIRLIDTPLHDALEHLGRARTSLPPATGWSATR